MDRCSDLTSVAAPPAQRDFHLGRASDRTEPARRMPAATSRPTTWVLNKKNCFGVGCAADRKSTRLNSSHGYISYAVFCLKKKKIKPKSPSRLSHLLSTTHVLDI